MSRDYNSVGPRSIWSRKFSSSSEVPLDDVKIAFSAEFSNTNIEWIEYLLDPHHTDIVSYSTWKRFYHLFGPLRFVTKNILSLMKTKCFFGYLTENIAKRIIQLGEVNDHFIYLEDGNISILKLENNQNIASFLIRKVTAEGDPKLKVFCFENLEYDTISKILNLFPLRPFSKEFPKLRFFYRKIMNKEEAKEILKPTPVGSYFLRLSENDTERIVLSYKDKEKSYQHVRIKEEEPQKINVAGEECLKSLLQFFTSNEYNINLSKPISYQDTRYLNLDLPIDFCWLAEEGGALPEAPGNRGESYHGSTHQVRVYLEKNNTSYNDKRGLFSITKDDSEDINTVRLMSLIKTLEEKDLQKLKTIKDTLTYEYPHIEKIISCIDKIYLESSSDRIQTY